ADVEQLASILPLPLIPGGGRERHGEDLAVDVGACIRGGQPVASEQLHVRAELQLAVHFGLQKAVAERRQDEDAAIADGEALILRVEARGATGRAVRRAQLEVADL